jgi:hypothetical protein
MAVCFHGPILSDEKARNGVDWASGLFNAHELLVAESDDGIQASGFVSRPYSKE